MNSDLLIAKFASELSFLQEYLEEAGFACQLLDAEQGVELPILVAVYQDEEEESERALNFVFVPTGDELETLQMLQIFSLISGTVVNEHLASVEKLLVSANRSAGMGSFGLDSENQLFYKYMFPKAKYERWNRELVMETVFLFLFLMDRFGGVLAAAASGELSLEAALEELSRAQQAEE
jgi:hypothetical protein